MGDGDRSKPARGELFGSELCQMDLGPKGQMMGQKAGDWLCHDGDALTEEVVPVLRARPGAATSVLLPLHQMHRAARRQRGGLGAGRGKGEAGRIQCMGWTRGMDQQKA